MVIMWTLLGFPAFVALALLAFYTIILLSTAGLFYIHVKSQFVFNTV